MPKRPLPALDANWVYANPVQLRLHLRIAGSKIRHWIKSGQLIALNVASDDSTRPLWRIERSAFDAFMASRTTAPAPAKPVQRRRKPAVKSYVGYSPSIAANKPVQRRRKPAVKEYIV